MASAGRLVERFGPLIVGAILSLGWQAPRIPGVMALLPFLAGLFSWPTGYRRAEPDWLPWLENEATPIVISRVFNGSEADYRNQYSRIGKVITDIIVAITTVVAELSP